MGITSNMDFNKPEREPRYKLRRLKYRYARRLHVDCEQILETMMTSSNGRIFRVTDPLCGEFTGHGEFPAQRPMTRALMSSLICARMYGWVNNCDAGDLRRHGAHYDVTVMTTEQDNPMNIQQSNINVSYGPPGALDKMHMKTKQSAETSNTSRWRLTFCGRHFQKHFLDRNISCFD